CSRPYPAPMPAYNFFDDGKSDAGSFKFPLGMQPLKNPEQPVVITHIETGPVVPDIINNLVVFVLKSYFDKVFLFFGSIFYGVGNQVLPEFLDQHVISQ